MRELIHKAIIGSRDVIAVNAKGQRRKREKDGGVNFDMADGNVGDWQFLDPDPRDIDTEILIRIPDGSPQGSLARLPLIRGKASSWQWDGNREAPTLTPSILHDNGNGTTWHGYMTKGELISV